jgi:hypothetical protein
MLRILMLMIFAVLRLDCDFLEICDYLFSLGLFDFWHFCRLAFWGFDFFNDYTLLKYRWSGPFLLPDGVKCK